MRDSDAWEEEEEELEEVAKFENDDAIELDGAAEEEEQYVEKNGCLGNSWRKYANTPPKIISLLIVAFTPTKNGLNPPLRSMSAATVKKVSVFIWTGLVPFLFTELL